MVRHVRYARIVAVGVVLTAALAAVVIGASLTTKPATIEYVTTEWLGDHLNDPGLVVVDCQPNVHDYIAGHIPGAVYMNEGLLRMPQKGMPAQYVPADNIQTICRELGIQPGKPVVIYSGKGSVSNAGGGLEQPMVAYTLARFGVDKVYILDGGLEQWKAEKRKTSQEFPKVQPSKFKARVRDGQVVTIDQVKEMKDQPDVVLIDARPAGVYAGKGPWIRSGHIPGAVNIFWKELVETDNPWKIKSKDELKKVFAKHGVTPDKTIIVSCGTGREATQEYVILSQYLGYPKVKIYEGSFTEWSADPNNPTKEGDQP